MHCYVIESADQLFPWNGLTEFETDLLKTDFRLSNNSCWQTTRRLSYFEIPVDSQAVLPLGGLGRQISGGGKFFRKNKNKRFFWHFKKTKLIVAPLNCGFSLPLPYCRYHSSPYCRSFYTCSAPSQSPPHQYARWHPSAGGVKGRGGDNCWKNK